MTDVSLENGPNHETPATPLQRLHEARWALVALAGLFGFFAARWSEDIATFAVGYVFIAAVVAFSPRKKRTVLAPPASPPALERPIWPETQVKLFVNAIPEPGVVLDGDGIVRHINPQMRDAFGSLSQGDPMTLQFRDPKFVEAVAQVQRTGKIASVPYIVRFPTEQHFLIHIAPINLPRAVERASGLKSSNPDFIFVVMIDETERFRAEELRSDFIANVSHELRTPVASLTGFIETLLGAARDDPESRDRFLKIMLEQAQRMTRLVNDLLSLSRIEMRSHVRPTDPVDVGQIVLEVGDIMMPISHELGLDLELTVPEDAPVVLGDKDELVQVVQNLVENACKYGSEGKGVDVTVDFVQSPPELIGRGSDCALIEVRDYGKGIPPEHIPRLTERFYRVDAEESKKKMGTGLGLALVKHILSRHKAALKVTSVVGEGASFKVFLPILEDSENVQKTL
ncbi:MAG: ATP-binding protein [Pseudomonadota bacterium]